MISDSADAVRGSNDLLWIGPAGVTIYLIYAAELLYYDIDCPAASPESETDTIPGVIFFETPAFQRRCPTTPSGGSGKITPGPPYTRDVTRLRI